MNRIVRTKNSLFIEGPNFRIRLPKDARVSKFGDIYTVIVESLQFNFAEHSDIMVFERGKAPVPISISVNK